MMAPAITPELRQLFKKILFENECGGQFSLIYKFTDPDGVGKGKSGYSFGITQFDIANNPIAMLALREIGFTTDEIAALRRQDITDIALFNSVLETSHAIVDKWDQLQIDDCLVHSRKLLDMLRVNLQDIETYMHIADYHNQFYFSNGGKLYRFLESMQGVAVTPAVILKFKYTTLWGRKQKQLPPEKDDVLRRYNTIAKIMKGEGNG